MASSANTTPAENDLLCEHCGYILSGLPESGNCPECGSPIATSTTASPRHPSTWEQPDVVPSVWLRFVATSAAVIFRPAHFYRTVTARGDAIKARNFARIHWILSSALFGLASWLHWDWYERAIVRSPALSPIVSIGFLLLLIGITLVLVVLTTELAAKLTTWEATYRGYRLPTNVVMRALYFHAAHFLPVALLAFVTVAGYSTLQARGVFQLTSSPMYLYVLSGEVIVSAGYLFNTYWIGMRNLLYANY